MAVVALDLGGTKLAAALCDAEGAIIDRQTVALAGRKGEQVGELISTEVEEMLNRATDPVQAIGICIPGIYRSQAGTVWVPNIDGWSDYPLLQRLTAQVAERGIAVRIDSDRACYIMGEIRMGAAHGCRNAIFLAVGTGIGAGIIADGRILRGHRDIAGAIGWLGLDRPFRPGYTRYGCFEYAASGDGLVRYCRDLLQESHQSSTLRSWEAQKITAPEIFAAAQQGDSLAKQVLQNAVELWGMAVANLVSVFNPEKIVFGGGVFGPAVVLLDDIYREAKKWAQPIAINQVELVASALGGDAGLLGAAALALTET